MAWSLGGWILGFFFNAAMISLSLVLFLVCNVGLPLLTAVTEVASDARREGAAGK